MTFGQGDSQLEVTPSLTLIYHLASTWIKLNPEPEGKGQVLPFTQPPRAERIGNGEEGSSRHKGTHVGQSSNFLFIWYVSSSKLNPKSWLKG